MLNLGRVSYDHQLRNGWEGVSTANPLLVLTQRPESRRRGIRRHFSSAAYTLASLPHLPHPEVKLAATVRKRTSLGASIDARDNMEQPQGEDVPKSVEKKSPAVGGASAGSDSTDETADEWGISESQTAKDYENDKFGFWQASAVNTLNMFGTGPFITVPFLFAATIPAGPQVSR